MAPIELAYFCYKKDEELVRVADTKLMPIGIKTFRDGGAKRGLAGQITSEDGRDVTADSRRLFVLEWPEHSTFDSFYQSTPHFDLEKATTPFLESPAEIKLYETAGDATSLFKGETGAALWSLEIIEVKPKDADMSEEAAQDIFQKVAEWSRSGSGSGGDAAACGTSLDPKTKEIVVIRTISSQEPAEVDDSSRYPALAEIAEVALMKRMVAQVGLM
ncbi:hypothetical protein PG985_013511 [Apiospora marii]|uniref:uncharacterized protein n=1 Tax=Apiospora marii TaxID=335849 RepID=UPI00312ECD2E